MFLLRNLFSSSIALLFFVLVISGCGSETKGPKRYDVSGTVTFDGKPVPYGSITFTPDDSKGNGGSQGVATIRDGKYDTAKEGKATIGGPHKVRITGTSKEAEHASEDDTIPPLFSNYQTDIDLPETTTTHNFEVPASEK